MEISEVYYMWPNNTSVIEHLWFYKTVGHTVTEADIAIGTDINCYWKRDMSNSTNAWQCS